MEKITKIMAMILAVILIAISAAACQNAGSSTSASEDEPTATQAVQPSETEKPTEKPTEAPTEAPTEPAPTTHIVKDHANHEVELPYEINRVVVCDIYPLPSILTVFFDSADKLVGIAKQSMVAAKNSLLGELYPDILNAKTDFIDGTTVNLEELLKLNPDIVFVNAGNQALYDQVTGAGLKAFGFSAGKWQYDALETLNQWVLTLDEIFEGNSKYEIVKDYGEKVTKLVNERVSGVDQDERVMFLFQYTAEQVVVNGNPSFGSWWSKAIGLANVVTDKTSANSLPTNMEQIYTWNPTILFVTNFTTATAEDIYRNKVGSYDWSSVDAVKNGRVYKMPLGMYRSYTPGVDCPVTLLWMAKTTYPDLFEDIDV
ncbi:MAG: ABC transporter substrate-binding protein, partial [Lachnospiraceae bacterium]|nr:ABC transporter substrate-binding protein [Lachnospiraceae bacterium]